MSQVCFLCGANGSTDPLDTHHIFGGALRGKSEKLDLTVRLCHAKCHIFGEEAVHRSAKTRQKIQEYGQAEAMKRYGWTKEQFIAEFGKNYLSDEQIADLYKEDESTFHVIEEEEYMI